MFKNKVRSVTITLLIAQGALGLHLNAQSIALTTRSGETYHGEIKKSFQEAIYLRNEEGVTMKFDLENLEAGSLKQAQSFLQANPERNEIYAKVDESPRPKRPQQPEIPAGLKDESGNVYVWIVIDEQGGVILSEIHKSTNDKLNQVSLDCLNAWTFQPAKISGTPVKCELIVPLRFR